MKLKLTFLFVIVIATCKYNLVSAQMTDSTRQIINRLLQIGYEDTSDLEDFLLKILSHLNPVVELMLNCVRSISVSKPRVK